jgi:hypothetical protein
VEIECKLEERKANIEFELANLQGRSAEKSNCSRELELQK